MQVDLRHSATLLSVAEDKLEASIKDGQTLKKKAEAAQRQADELQAQVRLTCFSQYPGSCRHR